MTNKCKVLFILGPSGAGKDSICKELKNSKVDWNYIIHYTTRPRRTNEVYGEDYYFVPDVSDCSIITEFRDWKYGLDFKNLKEDTWNIIITNPKEYNYFCEYNTFDNIAAYTVYVTCPQDIRVQRQYMRGDDVNEIARRLEADLIDFDSIKLDEVDLLLNNDGTSIPKEMANKIIDWTEKFDVRFN